MKPYHIAMGVALAGAAALVIFGDNTPSSDIAEPVARPARAPGAVNWATVLSVLTPVFSSNRAALAEARSTPASATLTSWFTTC